MVLMSSLIKTGEQQAGWVTRGPFGYIFCLNSSRLLFMGANLMRVKNAPFHTRMNTLNQE